jgi:hypothetical protein
LSATEKSLRLLFRRRAGTTLVDCPQQELLGGTDGFRASPDFRPFARQNQALEHPGLRAGARSGRQSHYAQLLDEPDCKPGKSRRRRGAWSHPRRSSE